MLSDKSLYFKEGYKYWVNRPYHIEIDIHPIKQLYISFKTVDIELKDVEIPMVSLDPSGLLIIYPSYVWDGASGPTIDTLNSMRGSLIHDALYQLIRLGLIEYKYKDYADKLLHDLCTEDGMWSFRADYWQWSVSNFGSGSCRPSAEHLESVAP